MQIIINGNPHQLTEEVNISELLQQLQVDATQVAVEKNEEIISRSFYGSIRLQEGDKLELVEFVGGG